MLVFFDTNILIYGFSNSPDHLEKRRLAQDMIGRTDWCLSGQVLQEFAANIIKPRHAIAPEQVITAVKSIAVHRQVCPVDTALVLRALETQERFQVNYWDAAIISAAQRMRCAMLFTEDLNHGQNYAGVVAVNPFLDTPSPAA
jgi:predicted nucleic acid-binding protein